jgi:uncharacterized protein YsxB (DUF464 family)
MRNLEGGGNWDGGVWFWYGFSMILIWFELWFLMWVKLVIWSQRIGTISKIFQNRIKTISKPYQNRIKIVSEAYQNRIKIKSKTSQNHKNNWKLDQKHVPGLCLFLFLKPTHWNHIKTGSKSYQNRIKIVSKAYQNRTQIASKPDQNHTKTIKYPRNIDQKPIPALFLFLFLKPTRWNHIKTVSKSYQNRIKIVSKSYQNHIKIISKS